MNEFPFPNQSLPTERLFQGVECHGIFVTDFDGTLTARDFYEVALERLIPEGTPDYWSQFLANQLSLFDVLQKIFASIRADEAAVLAAADECRLDPGAGEASRRLIERGWQLAVASAGCRWYIERLLAKHKIVAAVVANPGDFDPHRGLLMRHDVGSPYDMPHRGVNKAEVVRDALRCTPRVAYAGDSRPDLEASLLVASERRFARGILAEVLREQQQPFRPFDRWSEIPAMLLADG